MKPMDRIESVRGVDRFFLNHREVTEADYRATYPLPKPPKREERILHRGAWTPLASEALGVHPKQINEAKKDAAEKGVQTDFTPDGRPLFRDRDHRNRYLSAYGYFDRDGGYGDVQRGASDAAKRQRDTQPPHNPFFWERK